MTKPVKLNWGRNVNMVPIYGGQPGSFADDFIGDVYVYAPNGYAIDKRGRRMWSVRTRNNRNAISYHKSEAAALKRSRSVIRGQFNQ